MRIEIAFPTLGREGKMLECIGSINDAKQYIDDNVFLYLYFSSVEEYKKIDGLLWHYRWILPRLIEGEYTASSMWNNHTKETDRDIFIYLTDDVVLKPDCLKNVVECMKTKFPDDDGVVGIVQENIPKDQALPTAFAAVGRAFLERFPKKAFMCPDYKRFYIDRELYEYSKKIGRFHLCEEAKLIHKHPAFYPQEADETHNNVRKYLSKDREMYNQRKAKGYLWGENFNLIGDNK